MTWPGCLCNTNPPPYGLTDTSMLKRPQTLSSAGCMYESSKGNFLDRNPLATVRPKHPSSFIPNVVNALLECGVAVRRLYWSGTQKVDDALNEHCALMTKHNETHSVLLTCGQDVGLVAHSCCCISPIRTCFTFVLYFSAVIVS